MENNIDEDASKEALLENSGSIHNPVITSNDSKYMIYSEIADYV